MRVRKPLTAEQKRARADRARQQYYADPEKMRAKSRAWYHANKGRANASAAAWKANNPDKQTLHVRRMNLKKYGITPEAYEALLSAQNNHCAICGEPAAPGRSLDVDHDHSTGAVRGLLCNPCNRGLAAFRENAERMRAAIAYVGGSGCP